MLRSRLATSAVAASAVVLLLAGCGSSKPASSGTTTGGTTGSSNAPAFKVMVMSDDTSTGLAYTTPEVVPAVKGAFRHMPNVTVISCDTKSDSGATDSCEQEAVQDHVAAVILGFVSGIGTNAILTQAGIPVLGDANTASTESTSFSAANGYAEYYGIGIGLANAGCKKYGTLYLDGTTQLADSIKDGAATKGLQEGARAAVAFNEPDLAPAITKLTDAGVDCIALSVVPTQVVQAVTAIDQTGKNIKVAAVSAIFTSQVISSLGSKLNGAISINQVRLGTDHSVPGTAEVTADMTAIDPSAPVTQNAIIGWVGAKMIIDALPSIKGAVTASSLMTALAGLRNASTDGVTPPVSCVPLSNPLYTRLCNPWGINYQIENGQSVSDGGFYDLTSALDAPAS